MKTEKIFVNDSNIMSFDPSQLSIYNNQDTISEEERLAHNESVNFDEIEKELESKDEMLKRCHLKHCYKNRKTPINGHKYVYLAGKIKSNGWRESIVSIRNNEDLAGCYSPTNEYLANYIARYNKNISITGPWFLGCDHSCYHGDNSHGLGVCQIGCNEAEGNYFTEEEVYDICLTQIEHSNIVFAYIDDNTCYGTICEIGHAKALGKYIVIIFENEDLMSDMWFLCQCAHYVGISSRHCIKATFDRVINNIKY